MIRLTDQSFDPGGELNNFCRGRSQTGAVHAPAHFDIG